MAMSIILHCFLFTRFAVGMPSFIKDLTSDTPTAEILESVYGPLNTWTPIRATDVDPTGIFDGYPANNSIIVAWEPPATLDLAEKGRVARSLIERRGELRRRDRCILAQATCCYDTGAWIWQDQLYSAKDTFCKDSVGKIRANGEYDQVKEWYLSRDGTWKQFDNHIGGKSKVWFYSKWGSAFDLPTCQQGFERVVTVCRGQKTDSAGGYVYFFKGSHFQFDPIE